jgi:UDP-N-acetylglucosamine transferase subunit ALG13
VKENGDPFIFVVAGTDHHPFDRLVDWTERWLALCEDFVSCLIQGGTSRRPQRAEWVDYLPYAEMERAVRAATAVVSHGGPGTIMLAVHFGKKPIVVPRQQPLGEHVDDHQTAFARRLSAEGEIDLAETEESFRHFLDTAIAHGRREQHISRPRATGATVRRFAEFFDEMMAPPDAEADRRPARGLRPILITGIPRSGTSWVGTILDASGRVVYINEPLNPRRPPGRSPGILAAPVHHRFQYITNENDSTFLQPFREMLAFDYHVVAELKASRSAFDLLRLGKYWNSFLRGRLRRRRPLIDDPYAVFSVEWFSETLRCDAVVLVRHPAASVSSRKRLGYKADLAELLHQPLLLRDWLEPFRPEMEAALRHPGDMIWQGSLLWKMAYHVVAELNRRLQGVHVVRYEDLSAEPPAAFRRLFDLVDLPFTDAVAGRVREASGPRRRRTSRSADRDRGHSWSLSRHGLSRTAFRPLDSRAHAARWKRELSQREISRIRALTEDVAALYYTEEDWR